MQIKRVSIDQINPAPYNPRKVLAPGDPEYRRLERSLSEFGYVDPLVWNQRSGHLVGGHQRFSILKAQGHRQLQVSVVDLDDVKEKALNIALNKISGEWDQAKLAQLLDELVHVPDFDVTVTGFDLPDAQALIAEALGQNNNSPETFDIAAPIDRSKPAITRAGDIISIGKHRVACGDCTDSATVRRLMQGERAILFATDPPYLVNYNGLNHPSKKNQQRRDKNKDWSKDYGVLWDEADGKSELYDNFIKVALAEAIAPNAAWYCWHASRRQAMLEGVWDKHGAFVHQQIIWAKDRPILTRSWYTWQHEPCLFGWLKGRKPTRRSKDFPSSVWNIPTIAVGTITEHPTSKPVELFVIPMLQHTRPGELCYEPFSGSGTQIIAAERCGRRCFALELDPYFCDLAVRRYIALVGEAMVPRALVRRYGPTAPTGVGKNDRRIIERQISRSSGSVRHRTRVGAA